MFVGAVDKNGGVSPEYPMKAEWRLFRGTTPANRTLRSLKVKSRLRRYQAKGSMGRRRTCADNTAMESFYALVQKNVLNRQRVWQTRQEFRIALIRWINVKYNAKRRQRGRMRMTPIEYEAVFAKRPLGATISSNELPLSSTGSCQ